MGTVSLVESFTDPRNLATLAFYLLIGRLVWAAFAHGDPVIIMVSRNGFYDNRTGSIERGRNIWWSSVV